jgi:hypothetical protein
MGRKPAPQPLTLGDPTALGDESQSPRTGETLQVYSPTESRSPRSPRSPFRFGTPKKSQNAGGKQSLQVADESQIQQQHILHQQHQQQQQQQQRQAQQVQHLPQTISDDSQLQYPAISSALQQQPSFETPTRAQQDGPQPYQDDGRPTRSGFFSHFNKSKSSHQLSPSVTTTTHRYTDSRSEAMSRGNDNPAMLTASNKPSKPSGM